MGSDPTREIFWNIPPDARVAFYLVAAASVGICLWGLYGRYRLWRLGTAGESLNDLAGRLRFVVARVLSHRPLLRKRLPGVFHMLMFWSFVALFIGTTIIAIEYDTPLHFFHGTFFLLYEMTLDVAGVAFLLGVGMAAWRRSVIRPIHLEKPDTDPESSGFGKHLLIALSLILVTGYVIEGARLAVQQPPWRIWSPAGWMVANTLLAAGAGENGLRVTHFAAWWIHSFLVFGFIASIPSSGFRHIFFSPLQMLLRSGRPKGALSTPYRLEELETASPPVARFGAGSARDFSWRQRLSLDACTSCGRCDDSCPALASGTALSPKSLVLKLRRQMENPESDAANLFASAVSREEVWACTTCRACMEECPVSIEHIDLIVDLRRNLVDTSDLDEASQKTLSNLATQFNPWGFPAQDRAAWISRLPLTAKVRQIGEVPDAEVLYWVGCAASYDDRANAVARSFLGLLDSAGVKCGVLGREERCTGELARRFGEEGLFQELARENIRVLKRHKVKKIVTTCPHCLNTLRNEYPALGGNFVVTDHSSLLAELLRSGRLKPEVRGPATVTYHDPCYLGRHNDIYQEPRSVLQALEGIEVVEMGRTRERAFCCGAGGANYWHEVPRVEKCENLRLEEAKGTGASVLGVACPFCLSMFAEAAKRKQFAGQELVVKDVAEILAERMR